MSAAFVAAIIAAGCLLVLLMTGLVTLSSQVLNLIGV